MCPNPYKNWPGLAFLVIEREDIPIKRGEVKYGGKYDTIAEYNGEK